MYETPDINDPPVRCPYNEKHIICKSRIQKHIVKCEKNYPVGYKILCPYNGAHRVFPFELKDHTANCSARKVFEAEFIEESAALKSLSTRSHLTIGSISDMTDNWDPNETQSNLSFDVSSVKSTKRRHAYKCTRKIDMKDMPIRPPYGYSEAMMRETEEDPPFEDTESIVSSMAIGRGKPILQNQSVGNKVSQGRGISLINF